MTVNKIPKFLDRALGVHSEKELLKLRMGKVVVIGAGCDGCEVAEQLVRSGIGEITIIDNDVVEETNLNRQRLFARSDIGVPKVFAAKKRLEDISPYTKVNAVNSRLTYETAEILKGHDVVVQGIDSITARIMSHEIAAELGLPIVTMSGQPPLRSVVSTALNGKPLYQELFGINLSKPVKEMSHSEKENLDFSLCVARAEHAVGQGADPKWLSKFKNKDTSWSITLGRSPITGTLQTNETIRLLLGKMPNAIAPNIIVFDGNGLQEFGFPKDICKVLDIGSKTNWDYRLF